jgi:hypothetical protein
MLVDIGVDALQRSDDLACGAFLALFHAHEHKEHDPAAQFFARSHV